MQVSGAPLQVLQPRLDPQFYAPENIVNDQRINALAPEPLDSLRDPAVRMSYGVLKPEFVESPEYRLARIQNFLDPFLISTHAWESVNRTFSNSSDQSVCRVTF